MSLCWLMSKTFSVPVLAFLLFSSFSLCAQDSPQHAPIPVARSKSAANSLTVVVTDENSVAVPDCALVLRDNHGFVLTVHTDAAGRGKFPNLNPQDAYSLHAEKSNFYQINQAAIRVDGPQSLELTLPHIQELKETVNVTASTEGIDPAQTANTQTLGTPEIVNIPYPTSRDIRNILPYLPQVVQDFTGQVHVAGAATYETRNILDGFDITSPVSGTLSMRLSADAVRSVGVQSSRVSTEFGKFTGGIIDFNTGMGDDHFRFDATNFIPSWELRKGLNFDKWVPRATVSGPIVKDKAWFFDSADAEYDTNIFRDLPKGSDRDPLLRGSNLAKVQINLRPTDILSFGLLNNVQDEDNQGLSLLTPVSTTVKRDFNSYLADVKELHYFSGGALLELGFAENGFRDNYRPQGTAPFVITPNGDTGNYFEEFNGTSRRSEEIANLYLKSFSAAGAHEIKIGTQIDQIAFTQRYEDTPFSLLRPDGTLFRRSVLPPLTQFARNDFETGAYIEDRWSPFERLLVQPGVRFDWDEIIRRPFFSPRIAATYALSGRTKLSGGIGVYYDRTHLDYIARAMTGPRLDYYYDATGTTLTGPALETTFFSNDSTLEEPRFINWSLGVDQELPKQIYASVDFLEKSGTDGVIFQNTQPASILSGNYILSNTRRDHYHAIQFTARKHFSHDYNLFGSFTHSYAHSNAVVDYTLDNPIFSLQAGGPLPWDSPNRFITWGWTPVPWTNRFDFVYTVDYRTGFPWSAVNDNQQIVGLPDSHHFPAFFEFNPGLEWRFTFRGYALALRGVFENATDRKNPLFVNNNVDSTTFGTFSSFEGRAVTARIRFLGRK
ncbi:MAG TPA: hypothetical protein VFQ00_14425 [Terriglobales bacterium]|nr:hypothetical protein [Terriglobales bacterium]